jgi:rSAM/selenodomain-associated transferase 2
VADGGSDDGTQKRAETAGAEVLNCKRKGRSCQMNEGAALAKGDVLYFVHADVRPPETWSTDIQNALAAGYHAGCFSYRFNSESKLLKINARATRHNSFLSGGGDQTLFIRRHIFEKMGGFRNDLCIMEDFDFVWRLKKQFPFMVIPNDAIVSARKYERNGYLKVQLVNLVTVLLFKWGWNPERLRVFYQRILA